jgi:hypothetical protein
MAVFGLRNARTKVHHGLISFYVFAEKHGENISNKYSIGSTAPVARLQQFLVPLYAPAIGV